MGSTPCIHPAFFDDVLIPEDVHFYQHTRAAVLVRSTLHRYGAFAFEPAAYLSDKASARCRP